MIKIKIKDIEPIFNKYRKLFNLEKYIIEIAVADKFFVMRSNSKKIRQCRADFHANVSREGTKKYLITLDRMSLTTKNVEKYILHEFLHILFWEMLALVDGLIDLSDLTYAKKMKLIKRLGVEEHKIVRSLIKVLP